MIIKLKKIFFCAISLTKANLTKNKNLPSDGTIASILAPYSAIYAWVYIGPTFVVCRERV